MNDMTKASVQTIEARFEAALVDLRSYDIILINTSAGKDSLAMLDYVVRLAREAGVLDRVHAVHCDLGRVEWEGTRALAERQAARYGIPFHVVSRRQGDLLEHVEQKGKWPGMRDTRYCTSDHKRQQVLRTITELVTAWATRTYGRPAGARQARILNCLGLRAAESTERRKMQPFKPGEDPSTGKRQRGTSGVRQIDTWLPIHGWSTEDVWRHIKAAGLEYHRAYDLGMPRLSCVFCIYAGKDALLLAGYHNRPLLAEYVRVEQKTGHTFKPGLALVNIQAQLEAGYVPSGAVQDWDDEQCA